MYHFAFLLFYYCFRLRLYLPTLIVLQLRPVSYSKSQAKMLVTDWLLLTGLTWIAAEVGNYKRSLIFCQLNRDSLSATNDKYKKKKK